LGLVLFGGRAHSADSLLPRLRCGRMMEPDTSDRYPAFLYFHVIVIKSNPGGALQEKLQ
jgi:hypothetical protein